MISSFHLVLVSPWPFLFSLVMSSLLIMGLFWFHFGSVILFIINLFVLSFILILWLSDVEIETWLGFHTSSVYTGIRMGMILFIVSEVFFFFSFFWGFFHSCWGYGSEISWPPYKFDHMMIKPFGLPLLKTVLLLSSGVSMTYCHHKILICKKKGILFGFLITLLYGYLFLDVQFEEYSLSKFSMSSTIYGTMFFLLTGFHGFHVILGLFMIIYCFFRFYCNKEYSHKQHVSFEVAAWYWHFVDVVWLFLFMWVYWYGCNC